VDYVTEEAPRQATIFDVARLAGVSHQTVSRVVNDLPNVRSSTRVRVEEAIKKLRYVPSPAARALVTRRSRTIGLIATGGPEYGPSSTVLYFNAAARDARWSVFTANMTDSDPGSIRGAVEAFLRQNVEGIAVISGHEGSVDVVAGMELKDKKILEMPPETAAVVLHDAHDEATNLWGMLGRVKRVLPGLPLHSLCRKIFTRK
jgi:DNA-binding LacI/PurR family transcriptional regulator